MRCEECAKSSAGKCFYCANAEDQQMYNYPTENPENNGLTKREYFAAMAMQGLASTITIHRDELVKFIAEASVTCADALIEALNKERK